MTIFRPLSVPAPIQCGYCEYQRGYSTEDLLRPWLAQQLGQRPQAIKIQRDAHGRPSLSGEMKTVDVNWSHSGQILLVALGIEVRLGVDIEFLRPRRNALALAERFFAREEAAQLQALPETARETAFIRLWCAKEAMLKAHGQGISYGLDRVVFTLDKDNWRLTHCEGTLGRARDWAVYPFTPQPGYLAALAWRTA